MSSLNISNQRRFQRTWIVQICFYQVFPIRFSIPEFFSPPLDFSFLESNSPWAHYQRDTFHIMRGSTTRRYSPTPHVQASRMQSGHSSPVRQPTWSTIMMSMLPHEAGSTLLAIQTKYSWSLRLQISPQKGE